MPFEMKIHLRSKIGASLITRLLDLQPRTRANSSINSTTISPTNSVIGHRASSDCLMNAVLIYHLNKLREINWFWNMIVKTTIDTFFAFFFHRVGGERNDRPGIALST